MLKTFDVVVIDGPPLDNATDIAAFTTPVDAALYVLPAGKTKVRDLEARAPLLSKIRASVEGTVLSRRPRSALREV
jgi:Mrp family chromosome partitioning ATPase